MTGNQTIRMAAGQLGPIPSGSPRADTVERLIHLLRIAAERECHLVTFPELALTPFFPRHCRSLDEVWHLFDDQMPNSTVAPLFDEAKRLGIGFYLGYAEREVSSEGSTCYNSSVLVNPSGRVVGKYRKIHLPGLEGPSDPDGSGSDASVRFEGDSANFEKRYFSRGNLGFPVYDFSGIRVGMAICNDRRWPETYRLLSLGGAQITLIGYNTMARRRLSLKGTSVAEPGHLALFHNHLVMQAGAYQNAMWVVSAARAGEEDGGHLIGGSSIIAPTGEIVAQSYTLDDEVVDADCNLDLGRMYEESVWNFSRERQIENYRPIVEQSAWGGNTARD